MNKNAIWIKHVKSGQIKEMKANIAKQYLKSDSWVQVEIKGKVVKELPKKK